MTTIRYFIPEDGDDEMQPNVFLAPKPRHPGSPPTLGQIKNAFPLPGHYHFRFKSPLYPGADREKGAMAVWMDMMNESAPVPTWKNGIVAKVTRLSVEEEDTDDEDDEDFGDHNRQAHAHSSSAPPSHNRAPPVHQSSNLSTASSDHLDIFDGPSPAASSIPTPAPASRGAPPNLFDAHPGPHSHPAAPTSGGSLLDFGNEPAHQPQPASNPHADFLGMTVPAQPPAQQQPMPQQGYNANMYQQQQQQVPPQQQNAFNNYANQQGPFGGLGTPWK